MIRLLKPPPPQGDGHTLAQQGAQDKGTGGHLGEHRGDGRPRHPQVQQEDKHRIQGDIQGRPQHHRGHTQSGEALSDQKTVHPGGHQGEKGAGGIDGEVGIGVAEGGRAGPEPPQHMLFQQKEQGGQGGGEHQEHEKAVGQHPAGLLLIPLPHAHGQNRRASQAHQGGEGAQQRNDGAAHSHPSQRQVHDLRDIADIHAVHNTI